MEPMLGNRHETSVLLCELMSHAVEHTFCRAHGPFAAGDEKEWRVVASLEECGVDVIALLPRAALRLSIKMIECLIEIARRLVVSKG